MRRPTYIYPAINFAFMLLYLFFVLRIEHRISSEQRDYSDFGDSLDFLTTAVPVFTLSVIFSVAWGIVSVVEAVRRRAYQKLMALGLAAASWCGLVFVLRRLS